MKVLREGSAARWPHGVSSALGLLLTVACGPSGDRPEPPAAAPAAIVAGTADSQDPAVVAIGVRRVGCGAPLAVHCTGTLIAPRLVLTAAHCITDTPFGSNLEVLFGSDAASPAASFRRVTEVQLHPAYAAGNALADLALLILEESATAAPVPLNTAPLDAAWVGRSVRLVGFGQTQASGSLPGGKRTGTATISEVGSSQFRVVPGPSLSCHGDSGGPLLGPGGGGEVLIGVTAKGDPGCAAYGLNVRVDAFTADFLAPWIARIAASPPPPLADGPLAPSLLCSAPCVSSADCPQGLVCQVGPTGEGLAPRCVVPGLVAGALSAACATDAQCTERCVQVRPDSASCRCYTACAPTEPAPPPADGPGCSLSRGHSFRPGLLLFLLVGFFLWRRRHSRDCSCFRGPLSLMLLCTLNAPGDSHNQVRRTS